jgi:predicted CXXCH cytochrome family protein
LKSVHIVLIVLLVLVAGGFVYGIEWLRQGSSVNQPSWLETVAARRIRNFAIPSESRAEKNPWTIAPEILQEARNTYLDRCAICHGQDGSSRSNLGPDLYPKPPDLRQPLTQRLTDGELHYIIKNGVRLTGMPALGDTRDDQDKSWKLVLFIRSLAGFEPQEKTLQDKTMASAHHTGSKACEKCHAEIYRSWLKTPMANVVRDPREHPDAIIPDLSTNPFSKFTKDQVAFVYGSLWKQRYFTKVGDDYFPEGAQWDVTHKTWRPYLVANGTDWWASLYPQDNMKRPTGPTCDGCHSVDYDIKTRKVVEWNVGCEPCHGPGSEHAQHPSRVNILNPARMDYVRANDTCIQCHSQGRPLNNPIEGRYYDWPVGYHVGADLQDFWQLEEHTVGQQTFTHYADGTAHKNRMQGNDFVQSIMYRRGVTCFSCHDVHGTSNYAQLRKPANEICLDCHGPESQNGPQTATLEEHTHHKDGSPGSQCVACHMPQIEMTIADVNVSAHTFQFITPAMTERYKIPNPCTSCHKDQSTAWATAAVKKWPERSPWRVE